MTPGEREDDGGVEHERETTRAEAGEQVAGLAVGPGAVGAGPQRVLPVEHAALQIGGRHSLQVEGGIEFQVGLEDQVGLIMTSLPFPQDIPAACPWSAKSVVLANLDLAKFGCNLR